MSKPTLEDFMELVEEQVERCKENKLLREKLAKVGPRGIQESISGMNRGLFVKVQTCAPGPEIADIAVNIALLAFRLFQEAE